MKNNKKLFDFNRILFVNSYACNMNCPYCMHYEHKKNKKIKPGMQFGLENSINFLNSFLEKTPYKKIQITFSGGEPLIFYKDYLIPMIKYIRKMEKETGIEIDIDIFTNGTLINEEIIEFFKEFSIRIGISYDGYCGQKYRDLKTQEIVENNIRLCVEKIPNLLCIASTYSKETFPYIYDSYLTMLDMGVKEWSFAVDTLVTNKNNSYNLKDYQIFTEQINKIWKEKDKYNIKVNTFNRIKNFQQYIDSNKALIARPDGEICIGTTVPILIPEDLYPLFSVGYWTIDEQKLKKYYDIMGDFHIHVMGKNFPHFCEECLVKECCQDVKSTLAEKRIRQEADAMHCLEYLIISHIMKGEPLN